MVGTEIIITQQYLYSNFIFFHLLLKIFFAKSSDIIKVFLQQIEPIQVLSHELHPISLPPQHTHTPTPTHLPHHISYLELCTPQYQPPRYRSPHHYKKIPIFVFINTNNQNLQGSLSTIYIDPQSILIYYI